MTWYARSGPRTKDNGKFRSHAQLGTSKTSGEEYRGWSYSFVAHQSRTGVRRTKYAVSICDQHNNRVAYLRDFSTLEQATSAARRWIDEALEHVLPKPSSPKLGQSSVGTIPALPEKLARR